jgi:hypothetical protein
LLLRRQATLGRIITAIGLPPERAISRRASWSGQRQEASIAAGALVIGDPVDLEVAPLSDVAVSLYLPGEITLAFGITGRYARQTNYLSPPGNFAEATAMPIGNLTDQWHFVSGIEIGNAVECAAFADPIVYRGPMLFTRRVPGVGHIGFDLALRDPEQPTQMLAIYDCGDGLHPSDLGYSKMGDVIDLALFD